jgi:hypothetical protein
MTEIYEEYEKEMNMRNMWNPETEFAKGENQTYKIAYVESVEISNKFEIKMAFKKTQQNVQQQTPQGAINVPQEQIAWRVLGQGWK